MMALIAEASRQQAIMAQSRRWTWHGRSRLGWMRSSAAACPTSLLSTWQAWGACSVQQRLCTCTPARKHGYKVQPPACLLPRLSCMHRLHHTLPTPSCLPFLLTHHHHTPQAQQLHHLVSSRNLAQHHLLPLPNRPHFLRLSSNPPPLVLPSVHHPSAFPLSTAPNPFPSPRLLLPSLAPVLRASQMQRWAWQSCGRASRFSGVPEGGGMPCTCCPGQTLRPAGMLVQA